MRIFACVTWQLAARLSPTNILCLTLAILGSSPLAMATSLEATPKVSREALFERAFQSMPFLMTMASYDPAFRSSLSEAETKMFQYIDHIAQDARNRQWLIKNGIEKFTSGDYDLYYYVAANYENSVKRFHTNVRFGLEFSSDPNLFNLDSNPIERTAVTNKDMTRNIFVNQRRINHPNKEYSLGEAIDILMHEFGHKIPSLAEGLQQDKDAIDSLAVKVKAYINSQTRTFNTSQGKIQVLRFANTPYDQWVTENFFGEYGGINVPFKFGPLRIFDGEGTYVFFENSQGVIDLTDRLFAKMSETDIIRGQLDDIYPWRRLNWILSSHVQVNEKRDGRIAIELNMNQLQIAVPFLKSGVPKPEQFKPWATAYKSTAPQVGIFNRKEWTLNWEDSSRIEIQHEAQLQVMYEDPKFKVQTISQSWQGDDLVFLYRLPEMPKVTVVDGINAEFRPFLIGKFKGQKIEVPSSQLQSSDGIFEFRFPGLKLRANGRLEIIGMELGSKEPNLALSTEPRIKVYLPQIENVILDGIDSQTPMKLVRWLGWNGTSWVDLSTVKATQEISHWRLVFDSKSALTSLKLLIDYDWIGLTYSKLLFPKPLSTQQTGEITRPVTRWVEFSPLVMKQNFLGGKLFVDLPVDAGLGLIHQSTEGVDIPESDRPGWLKGKGPITAIDETMVWMAGLRRTLLEIEATNQSLQFFADPLEKPLVFHAGRPVAKNPSIQGCVEFLKNPVGNSQ